MGKMATALFALVSLSVLAGSAAAQTSEAIGYSPGEMEEARAALRAETGGNPAYLFLADRLEHQLSDGEDVDIWDMDAWYGDPLNKFWVKSEGEVSTDAGKFDRVEVQALYSRGISPYFDLQAGVRQDLKPTPNRTHAVLGIQGLTPYWFDVNGVVFLSHKGEFSASFDAEYEILLTQRLILQPRAELNLSAEDIPQLEIGSGLTEIETGLRLRYKIRREFAPYIGIEWSRLIGDTADFARSAGQDVETTAFVAGVRIWF